MEEEKAKRHRVIITRTLNEVNIIFKCFLRVKCQEGGGDDSVMGGRGKGGRGEGMTKFLKGGREGADGYVAGIEPDGGRVAFIMGGGWVLVGGRQSLKGK